MQVCAVIAYDGSRFLGFQRQTYTDNTVAGTIEKCLKKFNIDTKLQASGRTDRGVHASKQFISFMLPPFWSDLDKLHKILNENLFAKGIYFKSLVPAQKDFHPRFSAQSRSYQYFIKESISIYQQPYIARYSGIDKQLLLQAMQQFVGVHDFSEFCKSGSDVTSTVRDIKSAKIKTLHGYTICCFKANGFLRAQVRLMLGAAIAVAQNKAAIEDIVLQLSGQKKIFTKPASSSGLYLSNVAY
ncbi:MAG: tRNA pseudouridine(38-40) synthase TruA [Campylobacterota bacterium]